MEKKKPASAEERQKIIDSISFQDLEKVKEHQNASQGAYPVDQEWLFLAEFAKAFGWEAYKDARDDVIGFGEMMTLLEAHRKLEALDSIRMARDVYIGAITANSKKPTSTFKTLTKDTLKQTKVIT